MREGLIYILYGLILIGGPFLAFFWGRVAMIAYRNRTKAVLRDPDILIPAFIVLHATGTFIMVLTRILAFNTFDRLQDASVVVAYSILLGAFLLVMAKTGFVWALHCRRNTKVWKAFIALSAVWIFGVLVWGLVS